MSLYAHSIASPLTTELREDRSRRSASKIERWCPTAREQAALPPGCSHCKTLQVAACGTTLQDKSDKRFSGVIATPPRSVEPRRQFLHECGMPWTPRLARLHMARIVRRPCRVDAFYLPRAQLHRRGMEPVCSKLLGVLLQAALAFFRARLHRSMWAIRRTRMLPVCRTTKRPRRSRRCPMDRKCVGSV